MEAEFSDQSFVQAMKYQENPDQGDKLLAVKFYWEDIKDEAKSKEAGRPIYKRMECVEIRNPGERDARKGPVKYMKPDPRERFPAAYAKFKAREEQSVEGTPLREWGLIPSSRAREYEWLNVFTVEQLAALPDGHLHKIPGSVAEKQKAQDFLNSAKGLEPLAQARAEIETLRNELQALRESLQDHPKKKKTKQAEEE